MVAKQPNSIVAMLLKSADTGRTDVMSWSYKEGYGKHIHMSNGEWGGAYRHGAARDVAVVEPAAVPATCRASFMV